MNGPESDDVPVRPDLTWIEGLAVTPLLAALVRANDVLQREMGERQRVEEMLRAANAELAVAHEQSLEASQVKSAFVADVDHDGIGLGC